MPRQRRDVPWIGERNGVFYAFWYDAGAKRTRSQSLCTRDAAEAAVAFGKFLLEQPVRDRSVGSSGLTVSQALDDYLREHVDAVDDRGRPHVVDYARQHTIAGHLKAHFRDTPLKDIGPLESRAYVAARRAGQIGGGKRRKDKTGKDATSRRELNALVAASNHAVKWGRLSPADMPRIELPSAEQRGDVKWLTKEQLREALRRAAQGWLDMEGEMQSQDTGLHDFILLTYYTAARRRSIERLTKFQVDLAGGRISLTPEGAKRTKKVKPVVPIYPEVRPVLERLLNETETEYLFGEPRDFYRSFVGLLASMGVEAHPHMLRHSRATHMLLDGESIYKVARLLGDTVKTVDSVYGHCLPEYLLTESRLEAK